MPLEAPLSPVADRVAALNRRYANHSAVDVMRRTLSDPKIGSAALVSSFGAESVVLLHLISIIDRTTPVLFIDTELLFEQTLDYQRHLTEVFELTDVRTIRANRAEVFLRDSGSRLHAASPDACCALRKIKPLRRGLAGFDAWITGRKRFQGPARAELRFFEADDENRIKANPLAYWRTIDVADYINNNGLPKHPLVAKGFPSIGCMPCTTPARTGEDLRAGRWRSSEKTECGIHFQADQTVAVGLS